jgi:hypothetical protein
LFKTHITIPHHFEDHLRMREKTFRGAAAASATFKTTEKNCGHFFLILT